MLTRRLLFALPAMCAGFATAVPASSAPASADAAYALVRGRIAAAMTMHGPYRRYLEWPAEVPEVFREWQFAVHDTASHFKTLDDFLRHRIKTFFYNAGIAKLSEQGTLVGADGRLAHSAQLFLPRVFPLQLDQFDQAFVSALLALDPKRAA